ncbi:MAG: ribosome maturation factor RimP [Thermoanaerobaculia bacterium]|nr:ribosome maturation factor RimP [Thermoanaerobaculia bacterium]
MQLPEGLEEEIRKVVEGEGLELVHVDYRGAGKNRVLRVDIDRENDGVTVNDCELISRQLSPLLDVIDAIPSSYELQISSPGLDRKFYRNSDYERFLGSHVRVKTSDPVGGINVVIGRLESFDGERIVVLDPKSKKGKTYEIELSNIRETRLEPEF